jgi:thioester reductase-like protein
MTAFLTGFPGFLGSALTERLLARGETVTCLVHPQQLSRAKQRAATILERSTADGDRLELVTGDITEPALGMDDPGRHREAADECYHLAAIYDLGVDRPRAERVNVDGTERVLDFAERASVDRLHYVSTCYVSGRHDGVFGPEDLDVGQSFNNHYEATKFEAELAVQARMGTVATTVYRPSITVGDSETGRTDKYDGLYYLLKLLDRQGRLAVAPVQPPSGRYEFNAVPRDYVVAAIARLSGKRGTANSVYHLCDPNPPTVRTLLTLCGAALGRRVFRLPIHARAGRRLVEAVPGLAAALGVEPASLDYLAHPTRYVCPNTREALADDALDCPPLGSYIDRLVAYMRANPTVGDAAV